MPSLIDENTQFIDPLTSTPIVNGYIYIGTNGLDAKLNTITIYSDRDLTTPLANPQRTDSSGRSVNKIWVPGRYSMKVEDSANVQKLNDLDLGELPTIGTTKLTNVQGADTITAEGSPTITTLTDGQLYVFTAILANTGAVTLQIDATTAYPIKKNHDVALVANDLEANQMVVVAWNSTDSVFELQGHSAIESVNVSGNQTVAGDKTFSGTTTFSNDVGVTGDITQTGDFSITGSIDENKGADIASATTTDIGAATGNFVDITGTTTITGLGTVKAGTKRTLQFDGSLTLTYNATSMILPGNADIVTQAGDVAEFVSLGGGNWICTNYQRDAKNPDGLIYENNLSSAATTVTITGLDLDTDKHYRLEIEWPAVGSACGMDLFANNLTTLTDYYSQNITANGATISASLSNNPRIMVGITGGSSAAIVDVMYAGSRNYTAISRMSYGNPDASGTLHQYRTYCVTKTAVLAANLTQLDITTTVANQLVSGTKIRLYKA